VGDILVDGLALGNGDMLGLGDILMLGLILKDGVILVDADMLDDGLTLGNGDGLVGLAEGSALLLLMVFGDAVGVLDILDGDGDADSV